MCNAKLEELARFGQSIWLDNINRDMFCDSSLNRLIQDGLRGMTSNPTIFEKAISSSTTYDAVIEKLSRSCNNTFELYDELTIKDIQEACDIFMDVYKKTDGLDGYVSLEINPKLAFDIDGSIKEGKRLYAKVNRPNLMLKVPSTKEGFAVTEELTASGINVNVTLIFSQEQYRHSAHAYIKGVKRFLKNNKSAEGTRSVASIFVSRIDTACDKLLDMAISKEKDKKRIEKLKSLKGKAAVANSALIYKNYLEIFSSHEFKELGKKGANKQRVLWASTSTKNPDYSDIKYVTELIAKDTVNTLPEKTLYAFMDHGIIRNALNYNTEKFERIIKDLGSSGIDIDKVCVQLLADGIKAFENSFESLLNTINQKVKNLTLQN